MKIIICEPGKRAEQRVVRGELTLKKMQEIVGGDIEVVRADGLPKGTVIICNEAGKLMDLQEKRWISLNGTEDLLCGTFFICAIEGEEMVPLTDAQAETIARKLGEGIVTGPAPSVSADGAASSPKGGALRGGADGALDRKCCLCGAPLDEGEGNNAAPLMNGECCDRCNAGLVMPERRKQLRMGNTPSTASGPTSPKGTAVKRRTWSVTDQLMVIGERICDELCKYHDQLDKDEDYDTICGNCPLNLLM